MNSRWSTKPIKRDGQVVSIRPNVAGDIEILKALSRHAVLTAEDIAALTQRSYGAIIARLNLLKRSPNQLIQVHATQLREPRIYQWSPQVFHLADRGIVYLAGLGIETTKRPSKHFLHGITESQTAASFEVGARSAGLEHVVLPKQPIPVTFTHRGKTYQDHHIIPDGGPIGLGYGNGAYRFICFETDLSTEPLQASDRSRQAIETKLAAYLTMQQCKSYEQVFGIPNLTVLFSTLTETRMNDMRDILRNMSTKYLNYFGFSVRRTILSSSPKPEAGSAVTVPWLTVNGQLNLKEI